MKRPLCDYGNNVWKSPRLIEEITGLSKSSQIELNRKNRHGIDVPPFLFSKWAPNASEIKQSGTGKPREYYFTEILFLALSELFKVNGIPKELLSLFLVYFQYHIEMNPKDSGLKLLEEKNGLINFLNFNDKHIIKGSNKYHDGDSENIFWHFQIDTLISGERIASIECENFILGRDGYTKIDRFNILNIKFYVPERIEDIHLLQTKKEPLLNPVEKYTDLDVSSQIKFNMNNLHRKIKENTIRYIDTQES